MGAFGDRVRRKLERGVARGAAALALEINRELRTPPPLGTPVQDGNARANWIPSVGEPSQDTPIGPATGNALAAQGVAEVLSYKLEQGDIYIVNRTPYIKRLNDGYSKQSPALFVEAAIERAKTKVNAMGGNFTSLGIGNGASAQDIAGDAAENLAGAYSPFGGDG